MMQSSGGKKVCEPKSLPVVSVPDSPARAHSMRWGQEKNRCAVCARERERECACVCVYLISEACTNVLAR